jgi:hypothetical protein
MLPCCTWISVDEGVVYVMRKLDRWALNLVDDMVCVVPERYMHSYEWS